MIYGQELDNQGRCLHYHGPTDVVALACARCQRYYACYKCHDGIEGHDFKSTDKNFSYPVMCGICSFKLSFLDYKKGSCPYCKHGFNPKCQNHETIYFKRS